MRRFAFLLLLAALVPASAQKRAKNVILFLADAGGISTVNAASLFGYNAPRKLFIQSWDHIGLSDTSPVGAWVSDSAAGMTAIVTGQKTRNGVISQGPDVVRGQQDGTVLKTILEYAEERGLSTGVLSNVTIADATPAACYGHANDRRKLGELFLQIFTPRFGDGVDIVFGPGRKAIWASATAVGKDIDAVAKEKGRPVYSTMSEVPEDNIRALMVTDAAFDLHAAARRALATLQKNKRGYFLMIESDAHTDNPEVGLNRLVAFDKLIREIAGTVNPRDTLLLFTADHSFDLRIHGGNSQEPLLKGLDPSMRRPLALPFLTVNGRHTAEEVLAAAKGPGAERVRGFMSNNELFRVMLDAYGWKQ